MSCKIVESYVRLIVFSIISFRYYLMTIELFTEPEENVFRSWAISQFSTVLIYFSVAFASSSCFRFFFKNSRSFLALFSFCIANLWLFWEVLVPPDSEEHVERGFLVLLETNPYYWWKAYLETWDSVSEYNVFRNFVHKDKLFFVCSESLLHNSFDCSRSSASPVAQMSVMDFSLKSADSEFHSRAPTSFPSM